MALLEIASFGINAAIAAAKAGADRIELCDNPLEGGTTPSFGVLQFAMTNIDIPIFPIIRPRGGDFVYSKEEVACIEKDIEKCKDLGFKGIVIGCLDKDGHVAISLLRKWVKMAGAMECTFHRAFDRTQQPFNALEAIVDCGCKRILTSGQMPNAIDSVDLIEQLIVRANKKIVVMPGSGIKSNNVATIIEKTGATEVHASARLETVTNTQFIHPQMPGDYFFTHVDFTEVKALKKAIKHL